MVNKTLSHTQPLTVNYAGATHVGQLRDHNEDRLTMVNLSERTDKNLGVVLIVADGMGGANAGEIASEIACHVIEDRFTRLKKQPATLYDIEKYMKNLVQEAHYQIVERANAQPMYRGMGTTVVVAWLLDEYIHVVWCGDSRCYLYQKYQQFTLAPLTDDHSLVWQMVQDGELTPEEARLHEHSNVILQVLGSADVTPTPSYIRKPLETGEYILLCSDGLNGMLSDAQIQQMLEQGTDVDSTVETLIDAANVAGGTDNVTAILAEVALVQRSTENSEEEPDGTESRWPWLLVGGAILLIVLLMTILL